jgi:hypothetical protein
MREVKKKDVWKKKDKVVYVGVRVRVGNIMTHAAILV